MSKKTIVVLGMHRSGTSMVAGILRHLGVDMGKKLVGELPSNPLGHFEDKDFLSLNEKIIKSAGGDCWDNIPNNNEILKQRNKFSNEIINITNNRKHKELWGWKDPRTSLTIELYLPYIENPHFIVCYRNPQDVAESLYRRERMDIYKGMKIKKNYDQRIEQLFYKYPHLPRFNLEFEKLKNNAEDYINEIINFLKIEATKQQVQNSICFVFPTDEIRKISKLVYIKRLIIAGIKLPSKVAGLVYDKLKKRIIKFIK